MAQATATRPTGAADQASEHNPSTSLFFGVSHVEEDHVVSTAGRRTAVFSVPGMETDLPSVASFAALLNTLSFPVQILIRQHKPLLSRFRELLRESRPDTLTNTVAGAADSLDQLLGNIEKEEGLLDRRFYLITDSEHEDNVVSQIASLLPGASRLDGLDLVEFVYGMVVGETPAQRWEGAPLDAAVSPKYITVNGHYRQTFQMSNWPRTITPHFLANIMSTGVPMDISLFVNPIDRAEASRKLTWQKARMESTRLANFRRGAQDDPETLVAIEDIDRLRDQIERGNEKLFNTTLVISVHAGSRSAVSDYYRQIEGQITAALGAVDSLSFRQHIALQAVMPINLNLIGNASIVDTTTIALFFPFTPPDMDLRAGTLIAFDTRSQSLVTYDQYDGTFLNMNTIVLAQSGAGKSYFTKLMALRNLMRGVVCYIIDPEGEYVSMTQAAGGRVLTPGVENQGMNPFVIDTADRSDLYHRIGSLTRLIQVMIGQRLNAMQRGLLDRALTQYYDTRRSGTHSTVAKQGFLDFYQYLRGLDADRSFTDIILMLEPFVNGSMKYLLADESDDLLAHELPVTTFDLSLMDPDQRPAAAMVCIETVWNMAVRSPKPRMLIVDEVWTILQYEEGAAYLFSTAKRARKHQLGLLSITQDVQDLLSSGDDEVGGRALFQNAQLKILLKQDPAAVDAVMEATTLSPEMAMRLPSFPRGQGLLIGPTGTYPILVQATEAEADIIQWEPMTAGTASR